jgi:hypothetical protein
MDMLFIDMEWLCMYGYALRALHCMDTLFMDTKDMLFMDTYVLLHG